MLSISIFVPTFNLWPRASLELLPSLCTSENLSDPGWVGSQGKVYWCNRGALYCRYHIHVTFGDILISEVHTCDLHHLLQFSPLFTATVLYAWTLVCRVLHIRRVPAARVPKYLGTLFQGHTNRNINCVQFGESFKFHKQLESLKLFPPSSLALLCLSSYAYALYSIVGYNSLNTPKP